MPKRFRLKLFDKLGYQIDSVIIGAPSIEDAHGIAREYYNGNDSRRRAVDAQLSPIDDRLADYEDNLKFRTSGHWHP